jgi:predicted nucleotidyltransferase
VDIFKISKSKTRTKILKHFFSNKNEKYYLRQLERALGIHVANIRRELISLEKMGLFRKEKRGKEVYYYLNTDLAIYEEINKIVSKTIGMEAVLKRELRKVKGIRICFVYGSVADGKEDALSDIDVFLIGEVKEDDVLKAVRKLEKELSKEINYTIFTEGDLLRGVKEEKVLLKDVLNGSKIFLTGNKNDLEEVVRRK